MFRKTLLASAALLLVGCELAWALVNPAEIAPRNFYTQQVGYLRINVQASGSGITANGYPCVSALSGGGNCVVKVASLPVNAYLLRLNLQIKTNFNSTTTDTLSLGTNTTATNILGATTVHAGAGAIAPTAFAAGGSGILLTCGAASAGLCTVAQTGLNGGFDVYVKFVYTGATLATAGQAIFVLEYVAPNDGVCTDVPMNTLGPAC